MHWFAEQHFGQNAAHAPDVHLQNCLPRKLTASQLSYITNQNLKETMVLKRTISGQTGTSAEKLKSVENLNLGTNRNTGKLQLNFAANKQGVK